MPKKMGEATGDYGTNYEKAKRGAVASRLSFFCQIVVKE